MKTDPTGLGRDCAPRSYLEALDLLDTEYLGADSLLLVTPGASVGADVTFTAVPPSVKVSQIPPLLAAATGLAGFLGGLWLLRR